MAHILQAVEGEARQGGQGTHEDVQIILIMPFEEHASSISEHLLVRGDMRDPQRVMRDPAEGEDASPTWHSIDISPSSVCLLGYYVARWFG